MIKIEVTEDHIKLLRRMYVGWQDCKFGAPEIDPKRPYGNSDVENDIAEILGWEIFEDYDGERHLTEEQYETAHRLHREMEFVLRIFLEHAVFELGTFTREAVWRNEWTKQ